MKRSCKSKWESHVKPRLKSRSVARKTKKKPTQTTTPKTAKIKKPRRRPDVKWTPNNLARFIRIVGANGGNVTAALIEMNLSKGGFYERKSRSKRFAVVVEEAIDRGIDTLEDEARRRAYEGVSTPIVSGGKIITHVQKYSDFLMGLMLKAHRTKYRERHEITGPDGQPLQAPLQAPVIHAYIPDNGRKRDTAVIAENIKNGRNGRNRRNSRF